MKKEEEGLFEMRTAAVGRTQAHFPHGRALAAVFGAPPPAAVRGAKQLVAKDIV